MRSPAYSRSRRASAARAIGRDLKGKISPVLYMAAVAAAFWHTAVAHAIFVVVALVWLVPDRRIEIRVAAEREAGSGSLSDGERRGRPS